MSAPHLVAQGVLVRMLYDPAFAAAVRADPGAVLPAVSPALRAQLAAADPRALGRDVHRRERTLGLLCEELPCATTLALAETRSMATLLSFFGGAAFHEAITDGTSLVLALAAHLVSLVGDRTLSGAHLPPVLALELASARARRDLADAAPVAGRLRRAAGVEPVEVPAGALATLQAVEAHRFRVKLLPGWALVADAPALAGLPALGPGTTTLAAIALDGGVSLVELERPLWAVLASLGAPRAHAAVLDEAALRLGGDRAAAEAALASLVADELVAAA